MNRKILSVLIVLIFALSISTVVAADTDNTDVSIDDSSNALEISKSFGDLQDAIDDTTVNGTCDLNDDYMYYPLIDMKYKDGVTINKNITIDGNGHTINGLNLARIFNIENNGNDTVTVTLKNLTLKNGKTSDNGGAILISEGNSTFLNCNDVTFNNCKADNGGAIYATSKGYLNITNCIFTENEADDQAGAIYSMNNNDTICPVIINKSAFINNKAGSSATIIYCYNITANYSIFDSEVKEDSSFIIVGTALNGTALSKNYWGTNNATWKNEEKGNDTYLYPIFAKYAETEAINVTSWYILTLDENIITSVTEEGYRGNVTAKFQLTNDTGIISDSEVLPDYNIIVNTSIEEFETVVKNNTANIEFEIPSIKFKVTIINNNDVNITSQNYTVDVPYNSFSALAGNLTYGTIIFDCDYKYYKYFDADYINGLVLNNAIVINGNGFSISGSDLARIFYVNNSNVYICNLTLKNGKALTGAAIYATENIGEESIAGLYNNYFVDNKALKGAAIYTEKSITLLNNYFTNNVAFSLLDNTYGGAIYALGNVKVFKGSFIKNSAMYGAAIYAHGDISATSSIFDGNVGSHGTIYSMSTVSNIDFCFWGKNYENEEDFIDAGLVFAEDVAQVPHKWVLLNLTTPLFETPQFYRTYTISLINVNDGSKLQYQDLLPDYTVTVVGLGAFNNNTWSIANMSIPVVSDITISQGDAEFQFALFTNTFLSVRNNKLANIVTNTIGTKAYTFSEYQKIINGEGAFVDYIPVVNITTNETTGETIEANILLEDIVFNPIKDIALTETGLVINNYTRIIGLGHSIISYDLTPAFTINENGKLLLTMTKVNASIINNGILRAYANFINGNIVNNNRLSVHANIMGDNVIINNGIIKSLSFVHIVSETGTYGQAGNFSAYLTDDFGNLILPNENTTVTLEDQYGAKYTGIQDAHQYYVFNYPATLDVQTYHFTSDVNDIPNTIALGTLTIAPTDSFSALNNLIANTPENGILNLTRNYKYYEQYDSNLKEGIIISNNITINGNGYTVDAQNDARIFKVTADEVIFNNLVFANGYVLGEGAAIYTENSTIVINVNNTFVNNNARFGRGGAIYNKEGNTIVGFNNTFVDNEGTYGGAIYTRSGNIGIGILNNFANNTATSGDGGALATIDGDIFIATGNSFISNMAFAGLKVSHGGAVSSENGNVSIGVLNSFVGNVAERGGAVASGNEIIVGENNLFAHNSAVSYGGAIIASNVNIGNSIFNSNSAAIGGAIAIMGTDANEINLAKGIFIGNSAVNGGAIYTKSDIDVGDMVFINNTALNGGAIFVSDSGSLNVNNCTFIGNKANLNGGAIHSHGNVIIDYNNYFANNVAMNGGAIYVEYDNNLSINNINTFYNNSAIINGGAINAENLLINVSNEFIANSAMNGGAIYADGKVIICGSEFYQNSAINGGALYLRDNNATIVESIFNDNDAILGSAIYAYYETLTLRFNSINGTIYLRDSIITSPVALRIYSSVDENGTYSLNATLKTADGADVIIPGGFNLVDNEGHIYLCNLLTSGNGVYNFIIPMLLHSGEYTFEDTEIDGIEQLYVMGSLTIIPPEDSFAALYNKIISSNGTVVLDHDYKYYAIEDSHLQNGIPIENDVTIDGNGYTIDAKNFARIFKVSADNFVLNNINLVNGKALTEGAAIYTENSTVLVNNVTFRNNDALFGRGGAIYNKEGKTIINEGNSFINNYARYGGAAYTRSGIIIVGDNNVFTDNDARVDGGALSTIEGRIFVGDNNSFINNDAVNGGAISVENGTLTIENGNMFVNNSAINGGAIMAHDIIISYYNAFVNNIARYGGAIYGNNMNINGCIFKDNHADKLGGSIFIDDGYVLINNTIIANNSANKGAAIYLNDTDMALVNSIIMNNDDFAGTSISGFDSDILLSDDIIAENDALFDSAAFVYCDLIVKNTYLNNSADRGIILENCDLSLYNNTLDTIITPLFNTTILTPVLLNVSSVYDEDEGEYRVFATLTADGAYILTEPFNLVDNEGNIYEYNEEYSYDLHYAFDVPEDLETGVYTFENTEIEGINDLDVEGNLTVESHYELDAHNLVKYYGSADKLEAVVTDNGKAVAGVNVTFTINGRSYVRTTDENGVARLNINLNAGTYEANVTFGNITDSAFVYVKSTIDIDDFTKTYGQYGAFEAQFCDQFGHDLVYKDIKYNINGVFYTHTTNADGEDHLNINLLPGEYIITVYNLFTGEVASATVTVLEPTNEIVA